MVVARDWGGGDCGAWRVINQKAKSLSYNMLILIILFLIPFRVTKHGKPGEMVTKGGGLTID